MNTRNVRSLLKRASRHARTADAAAPATGRRLDPSSVDAALEDERVEFRAENDGPAQTDLAAERFEAAQLLKALHDQLGELESHQESIRRLLDQVEQQATSR